MKRPYLKIPNIVARSSHLKPSEFRVLVALMSVNPCFPSHLDLVKWTGLGKTTINRILQSLKKKSVISWKKGNSYGKNNKYFVHQFEDWKINQQNYPQKRGKLPPKCGNQNKLIREYENYDVNFEENWDDERIEQIIKTWTEDSNKTNNEE